MYEAIWSEKSLLLQRRVLSEGMHGFSLSRYKCWHLPRLQVTSLRALAINTMRKLLGVLLFAALAQAIHQVSEKGKRYTFTYKSDVTHAIPGAARKQIGLRLQCVCHADMVGSSLAQISLESIQIQQIEKTDKEKSTTITSIPEAIAQLYRPVQASFSSSGQISSVRAHPQDPEWSVNIKRGLLNLLQISSGSDRSSSKKALSSKQPQIVNQKENTVVGFCPVTYTIIPEQWKSKQVTKITKTIDYKHCLYSPQIKESTFFGKLCESCQKSLGYTSYLRRMGKIEHTIVNKTLHSVTSQETHVITPMSEFAGQIHVTATQSLVHQSTEKSVAKAMPKTRKTGLSFKPVHPEDELRKNHAYQQSIISKASQLIQQLQSKKDLSKHEVPQLVSELISQIRLVVSVPAVQKLVSQALQEQNTKLRAILVDACTLAGSDEVAAVLQDKAQKNQLSSSDLDRVLFNLAFTPKVTLVHISVVQFICDLPKLKKQDQSSTRRQCYLSLGALVNRLSEQSDSMQKSKIQVALTEIAQDLSKRLNTVKDSQEKIVYLKAIGNTGLSMCQTSVLAHLSNENMSNSLRVECIWALRKMVSKDGSKIINTLLKVFIDARNHPELRMAAGEILLDKIPTLHHMQVLVNTIKRELSGQGARSNQVASWVISKLSYMAYYDNTILKDRAMSARLALRSIPYYSFGLSYSKSFRLAMFSDKSQSGFDLEVNKMNVPESYIPRNMNANLRMQYLGYKFNLAEVGARVEGIQDLVQQVISEVKSRQKRSIWDYIWSSFSGTSEPTSSNESSGQSHDESATMTPSSSSSFSGTSAPTSSHESSGQSDDDDDESATLTPSSGRIIDDESTTPTQSNRYTPSTPKSPSISLESDGHSKSHQSKSYQSKSKISMFMKLFGQELKSAELTPQLVQQVSEQVISLLQGKQQQVQTPLGEVKITKNKVSIKQDISKAFLLVHVRQLLPTMTGLPLHLNLVSTSVSDVTTNVQVEAQPSLWALSKIDSLKTKIRIQPNIAIQTKGQLTVHNPFVRVGLQINNNVQMRPWVDMDMESKHGKKYTVTMENPTEKKDVIVISPNPAEPDDQGVCGIVEVQKVNEYVTTRQEINLDIPRQHVTKINPKCFGESLTGVKHCISGEVPNLAAMRLSEVPVLTALLRSKLKLTSSPTEDASKQVRLDTKVTEYSAKQMNIEVVLSASGQKIKREVPANISFNFQTRRLVIKTSSIKVPGYSPKSFVQLTADLPELKSWDLELMFGEKSDPYRILVQGRIEPTNRKKITLTSAWNKLPSSLQKLLKSYEPQLLYYLQTIASVSRSQSSQQQRLEIILELLSPLTARMSARTPIGDVESKVLSLPVTVHELPSSLQDIRDLSTAVCKVHQQRVAMFDDQSIQLSQRKGHCLHILAEDKERDVFRVAVKFNKQGQQELHIQIHKPQQVSIVVKPNLSVLVNGQPCQQKVCEVHSVARIIKREQRVKISLTSKYSLDVVYQPDKTQVRASPLLQDRVRGLCGDHNGEQYQEFKSPSGEILSTSEQFQKAWRLQC